MVGKGKPGPAEALPGQAFLLLGTVRADARRSGVSWSSGGVEYARAPVGSEKPIAVRERLTEGPRDNYGRVAGGLMCPGDGPKKGQMAGLETRTGRHARLGHAMACIRRTGRREETFL